jgi:hypothetical protein
MGQKLGSESERILSPHIKGISWFIFEMGINPSLRVKNDNEFIKKRLSHTVA